MYRRIDDSLSQDLTSVYLHTRSPQICEPAFDRDALNGFDLVAAWTFEIEVGAVKLGKVISAAWLARRRLQLSVRPSRVEILWLGTPILSWPATVIGGVYAIEAKLPTSDSVVIREILKVQLFPAASGSGHVVHAIWEGVLRGRPTVRQLW